MLKPRCALTPQMKIYWEVRYDKLIEEVREAARLLGRPDPIMTRMERQFVVQNLRSGEVDVIGAK